VHRRLICAGAALLASAACSSDPPKTSSADVAACRDITAVNTSLNEISTNLDAGKQLFARIRTQAHTLVAHAPTSLRTDARALAAAIDKVKPIVDRTRSIDQLQRLEQTDPTLQSAMSDLLTANDDVRGWKDAHCKGSAS
jgi:hypothetical protein